MIDRLRELSKKLIFLNPLTIAVMLLALLDIVYALFYLGAEQNNRYLVLGISFFFWSCSLYSMINIFPNVPEKPSQTIGFFSRLIINTRRFFYTLLGLVFLVTSVAALFTAFKLLNIEFNHGEY
ncbi:MAG: hypothetical protein JKY66_06775 [Spongiibacteraceae bacterium]|nr:hypothetical protein [Spongiibacteraceae bacterium]